jgi:hypothetical protein
VFISSKVSISAHLRNLRQNFFWRDGLDLSFGRRSAWMISWLYGVRIERKSCSGWARLFGYRFPFWHCYLVVVRH